MWVKFCRDMLTIEIEQVQAVDDARSGISVPYGDR